LSKDVADGVFFHGVGFDDAECALQSHVCRWSFVVGRN
jgi:hypothetical protein